MDGFYRPYTYKFHRVYSFEWIKILCDHNESLAGKVENTKKKLSTGVYT